MRGRGGELVLWGFRHACRCRLPYCDSVNGVRFALDGVATRDIVSKGFANLHEPTLALLIWESSL